MLPDERFVEAIGDLYLAQHSKVDAPKASIPQRLAPSELRQLDALAGVPHIKLGEVSEEFAADACWRASTSGSAARTD